MATIPEIRQKYPQYNDLSDKQLADALYAKSYSDMDRNEFDMKIGLMDAPPQGLVPGSKAYADWAVSQTRSGKKVPLVSDHTNFSMPTNQEKYDAALEENRKLYPNLSDEQWDAFKSQFKPYNAAGLINPGMSFGLNDELAGLVAGTGELVQGRDFGKGFNAGMNLEQARTDLGREQSGPLGVATEVLGGLASGGPLKASVSAATTAPSLLKTTLTSAPTGMVMGGLYGLTSTPGGVEERLHGAATGALTGGAVGALAPAVGAAVGSVVNKAAQRSAQRAAVTEAIKDAPRANELKSAASDLFKAVDNSGIAIDTNQFSGFVKGLVTKAKKMRINPTLNPKSTGAFEELIGALDDVQRNGGKLAISDIHTLRQIAQDAALRAEPRDALFADMIVDGLDDFITKPGNMSFPPNRLGTNAGGNDLLNAISTWGRAKRVGLVESAIDRAKNAASGFENGLRVEFRKLLNNDRTKHLWTKLEREELERVVRGSSVGNLTKLAGMFGFNLGSGSANVVGGSLGLLVGGIPGAILGAGARKASEALTGRAANRAAQVVATPNIPEIPASLLKLLPAGTTLPVGLGAVPSQRYERQ